MGCSYSSKWFQKQIAKYNSAKLGSLTFWHMESDNIDGKSDKKNPIDLGHFLNKMSILSNQWFNQSLGFR